MLLTASRRMVFSASRRLAREGWSVDENERVYGAGRERAWGSGENYEAHVVLGGTPHPRTGMIVNLAAIKEVLQRLVEPRYDHHFLNLDTPPFDAVPPTPENLARQLLAESTAACRTVGGSVVACHLAESASSGATAYASGLVEREVALEFSAARRTCSPHLSDAENRELFGQAAAPAGHGHGYRLRVVLRGEPDGETGVIVPHGEVDGALSALHALLDHRHLNVEVAELAGQPMTTECLARFVFRRLARDLPVARVRLHENPRFFAEFDGSAFGMGLETSFSAAHCLRDPGLTDEENRRIYGKCSNPSGHGHRYAVQATVVGALDERSGTLLPLPRLERALERAVGPWDHRHLDREVEAFRDRPSTGENIVIILWPLVDGLLDGRLARLRLFETANNRFAVRRGGT